MDPTATSLRIRGALGGDRSDLEWVVERLTPMLLVQARYRMRTRLLRCCDPEDLVAHAWQVALPRLPDLDARDGRYGPVLIKFLSTTILLRINELLRQQVRRGGGDRPATADPEGVLAPGRGPWTQLIHRERVGIVQRTLAELDDGDREVIVLRLVEQRNATAVGELLGISANAVHVRLHRALTRLRQALPNGVIDELLAEA
ncbi:MAG: sigma-70 family RNA polymerase sigma factor [Planctomycetes bacterium]|nr:sigma-70 family RNA polymerase sigma factor [Planctomycetota bacterium]